jgi:hypothetical protein
VAHLDCRRCRRWKDCPGKEWYHYGEIRWCPQQIIWIYQHAETLREGYWVSKYEDVGGSKQLKVEAYFVKAGIAIAELDARAEGLEDRGELLITQIEDGRTLDKLSPGARAELMYLKGRKRKSISFSRWKREVWHGAKTGEKDQFSTELDKETH